MAGIGAILGLSFRPEIIILVLITLSVYDFIAVYKTKHMIKMAKSMLEQGTIMGLIIPPSISDFKESIKKVEPGGRFVILGGGDIVFPLLFSASLIPHSILKAIIVALFAVLGLAFSFSLFIFQKKREPIPALPPIALFSIIGYIITLLI
jgi:presenilin-like A22 family membrane protease